MTVKTTTMADLVAEHEEKIERITTILEMYETCMDLSVNSMILMQKQLTNHLNRIRSLEKQVSAK